jgi:hypothetical protein
VSRLVAANPQHVVAFCRIAVSHAARADETLIADRARNSKPSQNFARLILPPKVKIVAAPICP